MSTMRIQSIFSTELIFKFILGAIIFIVGEVNLDNPGFAVTLKIQRSNNYSVEESSYFSLKLNRNIYNQLEKEILKKQAIFSDHINLIDKGLNKNKYRSQFKNNILIESQIKREQKLGEYFLNSLSKLEFEDFSDSHYQAAIPILAQVNSSNIYKDIYDFDISLEDTLQNQPLNGRVPKETIATQSLQESKYFVSHFQEKKNHDYTLLRTKSKNINNTNSSLLVSYQQIPTSYSLSSLTSLPLINLLLSNNHSKFPFLQNSIADISSQSYLERHNTNSQLKNEVQSVYFPFTQIEGYELIDFNVPSTLNTYQKSEHQEKLDKIIEKQKEKQKKQRERMYEQLAKLREQREKAREKKREQYRKQRKKTLIETMEQQKKLHQEQQEQLRQ